MDYYFAPMEGLTGYIYRNAHHEFFPGVYKYFSPFIAANKKESLKTKELQDLIPDNNKGIFLVPQILTNRSEDFISTAERISQMGYQEINLNLGCPSGTVVAKGKGAGFLARPEELDVFLEHIFASLNMKISVKTRLGMERTEEFYKLIEIYNKYPLEELIIHPRVQKDFYRNKPDRKIFEEALHKSKNRICYNGDIFSQEDARIFGLTYPSVDRIMIGRGLITNPELICGILKGARTDKTMLKEFHDRIYQGYQSIMFGEKNVLFKMKELWFYMIWMFADHTKYAKKIKKSERLCDYNEAILALFRECEYQTDNFFNKQNT